MQYRISFLLLVVTVTAVALAGRPWLVGRNDFGVMVLLCGGWTATGFVFGRASALWKGGQSSLWAFAIAGIVANGLFAYTAHVAAEALRAEDSVLPGLPPELAMLRDAAVWNILAAAWALGAIGVLIAAWMKRGTLVFIGVAVSLLAWFAFYWWACVRLALESDPLA